MGNVGANVRAGFKPALLSSLPANNHILSGGCFSIVRTQNNPEIFIK
jgi:hypothetical protein